MALKGASAILAGIGTAAVYRYRNVLAREHELPTRLLQVFDPTTTTTTTEIKKKKKERVLIIGAGVVGVSTAYKLALQGHQVAILEPRSEPGDECSACAAGGMQICNVVIDKASWIAVLKCLMPHTSRLLFGGNDGESDSFQFFQMAWLPTLTDPFFLRWVTTFTKTSLLPSQNQEEKQQEMLEFTKFAVDDMVKMLENRWDGMGKKAGYNKRGSLSVSYEESSNPVTDTKSNYEPVQQLSAEKVLELEPSLLAQTKKTTGAKYMYAAKSASSGRFAKELARRCVENPKLDVCFLYNTRVEAIKTTTGSKSLRISELHTNQGIIHIPEDVKVVVTAGAWTPHILALMDLYAPVYPLKGYAMSVSAKEALKANPNLKPMDLPSRIVADKYMFTTRLGDEIRITSIGEFSEWDTQPTPKVDHNFRQEAIRQFPQLKDLIAKAKTYCGFRPFVSDGILLLGAVDTHENLFVSCGPGSNGWKLALGSGEVMTRLVSGQNTDDIKKDLGFDASAFSPAGRVLHVPMFAKLCRARWGV